MSSKKEKFFIPVAIDYPSDRPHIGHALEKVQADVMARYRRLQGFDVHLSMGLDEHGLKIQRYAQKAGKRPQEFVNKMGRYFQDLWKALNISNDDFIRTTEERHKKVVQKIYKKIWNRNDIYKGKYKGLYCVDCETFYLRKDLVSGKCPIHHKRPEVIEEETYFFKMGKYQKRLLRHIKENKNFIIPESKRNEIITRLKNPLEDLSISRTIKWGIPIPFDKKYVFAVWGENLINYLTTIDYPSKKFKKFWPADVHVIGKDIIWHHSVIWGSLLLSAGLPLPKTIFVHGFITVGGRKMSKSLGNVIDPFELVKKYGTDPVRYFLLREIPPTEDGDFTYGKFEQRYNADLASGLGNLVARVITMAGKLSLKSEIRNLKKIPNPKFQTMINKTWKDYRKALGRFKFNEALVLIWRLISFCDKYIEREKPWEKTKNQQFVISNLLFALGHIAHMLRPLLPETSEKISNQLGIKLTALKPWEFKIKKEKPLFPRLSS